MCACKRVRASKCVCEGGRVSHTLKDPLPSGMGTSSSLSNGKGMCSKSPSSFHP